METINYKDIDFSVMAPLHNQGSTSTVYLGAKTCYKLLDKLSVENKQKIYRKFMELEGLELDDVILPKLFIMDHDSLVGYTTDFFPKSMPLIDYFTRERYIDANDILSITKRVSQIVKILHSKGIILQDLSFNNILIDKDGNIKFVDLDGCRYKQNVGLMWPIIMREYYRSHNREYPDFDENFDRQSLFFSMLLSLNHRMIYTVKEYDKIGNKLETLRELRKYMLSLQLSCDSWVPYLDEVIKDDDHYVIDRAKQVSREKRLVGDFKIYTP